GDGGQPAHIGLRGVDDESGAIAGRIADLTVGEVRRMGEVSGRAEAAAQTGASAEEERGREHDEGADDDDPGHQGIQRYGHVPNLPCRPPVLTEGRSRGHAGPAPTCGPGVGPAWNVENRPGPLS